MEGNINNSSIYTEEEMELLEKSKKVRIGMVDNILEANKNKITHGGTARVVNEILTSLDTSINNSATARLKHSENTNKEAILDMVSEIIINDHKLRSKSKVEGVIPDIPTEYSSVELVPGELELEPEPLELKDFTVGDIND